MNSKQMLFLRSVYAAAQASMRAFGVPASVTIAQAILESGWGTTGLALRANNFFGIKAFAHSDPDQYIEFPTAEYVNGQRVMVEADFAKYLSPQDSFVAHARLLACAARYAPAMAVRTDPESFARALQACGYSTSPTYASMLIALMQEFDLTQYDIAPPAATPAVQA